ncbi:hypothetical protein ANCCEY_06854 [Ancylostoma ceylanicum]|uniref:Uncharacterized protein n=1 Tax=Ancylostoma ceylanicum TaxID=53326 RepID=A0A0D6M2E4_9BILA|nr:hypothetical protein ANCCEY_06854 [Ancylostoma ceylanicum]
MYPFNQLPLQRELSDQSSERESSLSCSSRKMAQSKDNIESNGRAVEEERPKFRMHRNGSVWRNSCVSRSLHPVFMTLQFLALFPNPNSKRKHRWRRVTRLILMLNYSALALLFNSYLLNKNMWLITAYKTLDGIDVCFRSAFHLTPPIGCYMCIFFVIVAFFTLVPFTFKVVEFIYTDQKLGSSVIQDTAFVIVPTLTLWNLIPLLYYDLYNRIVRFYCRTLIKSLSMEHRKRHFSLKFYYEQFLRITNVQEAVGNLFNPFILFSLAWSMLVLCLTIYFITQPHSSLLEPITPEQITVPDIRQRLTRSVHFTICWAALQVIVALMHICIICHTGMNTNETTRGIVNAVLRIVPDANADLDRFQISCFVHKMSTQFMWGMTVWRAFPLERTTFFTLVSVIVTYAFLLLKLKENPAMTPITRSFIIHNMTAFTTAAP